ncbi:MAG: adaptin domain-containing protein [Marinilabiliales bacterium]|nr:adaptin domain-containing protein [Marinilabiliales bacterium]
MKRPFSLWEQITLHDLIIQHEIPVPDFQKWLNSSNPTVVMFALRMIREFKQMDAEPEIRKALLHRDPRSAGWPWRWPVTST